MRRRLLSAALLLALAAALPASASAAAGELDPSFGSGGAEQLFSREDVYADGIAAGPEGKIALIGQKSTPLALERLLPNGALDTSFGEDGFATLPKAKATAVAFQPDGKIVIAGLISGPSDNDLLAARFLTDGNLDPTFGEEGVAAIPVEMERNDEATAVTIGAGGRVLLAGVSGVSGFPVREVATVVLTAEGEPDPTFSGDGVVTLMTQGSGLNDFGVGIVEGLNGTIDVADRSGLGDGTGLTVIQYTANGKPNPGFGGKGYVTIPVSAAGGGETIDLASVGDGRIVVVGRIDRETPEEAIGVIRLLPNGALDPTFGSSGIVSSQFGLGPSEPSTVDVTPAGKTILSVRSEDTAERSTIAAIRLDTAGALDPSFGVGGVARSPLSATASEDLAGAAIDAEGRLVMTGRVTEGEVGSVGLTRLLADPPPAAAPPPPLAPLPSARKTRPLGVFKVAPDKMEAGAEGVRFSGTASDADGDPIAKVQIALERIAPPASGRAKGAAAAKAGSKTCLALKNARSGFRTSRVKKGTPCPLTWLAAKGTTAWSFELRKGPSVGSYVAYVRAIGADGATESTFSKAAGDRRTFRVVPAKR